MSESANLLALPDVWRLISTACADAGSGAAWARAHGMSPAYVSQVLNATREPGPKILAALGLVPVRAFRSVKHAA